MLEKYKKNLEKSQETQVLNLFNSGFKIDLKKVKIKTIEIIEKQLKKR